MSQFVVDSSNAFVKSSNAIVGLIAIEFQDAFHLDFEQTQYIFAFHLTHEILLVRFQARIDVCHYSIHVGTLFEALILIDALFDEDAFKRCKEQRFKEFVALNFPFLTKQILSAIHTIAKHIAHAKEMRFLILDNTAVRRNAHFTIRERIQSINSLVA